VEGTEELNPQLLVGPWGYVAGERPWLELRPGCRRAAGAAVPSCRPGGALPGLAPIASRRRDGLTGCCLVACRLAAVVTGEGFLNPAGEKLSGSPLLPDDDLQWVKGSKALLPAGNPVAWALLPSLPPP